MLDSTVSDIVEIFDIMSTSDIVLVKKSESSVSDIVYISDTVRYRKRGKLFQFPYSLGFTRTI